MKTRCLFGLIMIMILCSHITFAAQITPSELLDRYAANRKTIEKHHIKSEEVSEYINSLNADINQLNHLEYESIQNGQLRELTIKESAVKINDKGSTISSEYSRVSTVIWDGQKWRQMYSNPSSTPQVSISKTDQDKTRYISVAYGGSCLDGMFYGDLEPVDLIMKKGSPIKVRPVMEKVNGHNCYVIEAATPNGEYTIWIDPEHGYNIAKAQTHKTNNDIFLGGVVSIKIGDTPGMSTIAKRPGSRESIHFYIDNVNFREVDGVWLPVEANYQIITDYDDQKATYKKHHKRTYVNLKPDFEAIKAFIPKIPEGSIVLLDWAPGIRYTWQNGKPVADAAR